MPLEKPNIEYRDGTVRTDYRVAGVNVHTMVDTLGANSISVPEHSIFLIETHVTVRDRWEGLNTPEHTWRPGGVLFLPAKSEVENLYVSGSYNETMLRIPQKAFAEASRGLAELEAATLEYKEIKDTEVFGTSRLLRRLVMDDGSHPMLVEAMTTTLAVAITVSFSRRAYRSIASLQNGLSRARRDRALEFIEQNLHKPILLGQIADAAALSPYHFSRSFKMAMGIGPVRYVLMRRVEMARRMLLTTSLPLATIALACGFSSQSHFATAFKEETTMTPTAFRRSTK